MNQRTVSEDSQALMGKLGASGADSLHFFASAPRDLVALLGRELGAFGAQHMRAGHAGVRFRATLEVAYRACLWSRLANRILMPLRSFRASTQEALYDGVRGIRWQEHVPAEGTLAVDFVASRSSIHHGHYGAQRVKDAVVDQLRERTGSRPSVDRLRPDVRINTHLDRDVATIAIDLSGESLHRRGYRRQGGPAPLKENVAAAILLHAGWPAMADAAMPLLDPMCGSGTLPIEAALIAADVAPGLSRDYFGLLGWRGHDAGLWATLLDEARQRRREGMARLAPIIGYDMDARAVARAADNLQAIGLEAHIRIEQRAFTELRSPWPDRGGLLVCNPPYGERLGNRDSLAELYATMADVLAAHFAGWRVMVLSATPDLASRLGLRPVSSHKLDNGPMSCRLTRFEIPKRGVRSGTRHAARVPGDPNAEMFANRLRKNLRAIGRWARRQSIDCYRLYDADMPEYAFAIDVYAAADTWVVAQEYQAPASIAAEHASARRQSVLESLERVLEVPADRVVIKTRRKHRGGSQYTRIARDDTLHEVHEHGCRLLVNFSDRLDTGLFLDHRNIRRLICGLASGRRFLNLFAYTGAASVQAAAGGATTTTSIDLSAHYLDWARQNLALNGFSAEQHLQIQADCLAWLRQDPRDHPGYGVILLDAPSFSNSKRMAGSLDVQRDHVALIRQAAERLQAHGVLIFSNHLKRFRMDCDALRGAGLDSEDITRETVPRDFARNPRTHHCWRIRRRTPPR